MMLILVSVNDSISNRGNKCINIPEMQYNFRIIPICFTSMLDIFNLSLYLLFNWCLFACPYYVDQVFVYLCILFYTAYVWKY